MIDYEVKIFNSVHEVAAPLCAKNRFLSTQILSYTNLPAASLFEMGNRTVRERQSSTPGENYARISYQLDAVAKTKAKCREIFKAADERMISMNFSRTSADYITYPDNPEVVRYVARYEAEIDRDGNLYRIP